MKLLKKDNVDSAARKLFHNVISITTENILSTAECLQNCVKHTILLSFADENLMQNIDRLRQIIKMPSVCVSKDTFHNIKISIIEQKPLTKKSKK